MDGLNNYSNKPTDLTDYSNVIKQDQTAQLDIRNKNASGIEKKDIRKANDCQTCKERKYQDDSDDSGVSFQSPTSIKGNVGNTVMSHEREHYTREASKAKAEGKEVLRNEIKIKRSMCPECGKIYVAGGTTTTVTKEEKEKQKQLNTEGDVLDVQL